MVQRQTVSDETVNQVGGGAPAMLREGDDGRRSGLADDVADLRVAARWPRPTTVSPARSAATKATCTPAPSGSSTATLDPRETGSHESRGEPVGAVVVLGPRRPHVVGHVGDGIWALGCPPRDGIADGGLAPPTGTLVRGHVGWVRVGELVRHRHTVEGTCSQRP